eukprot:6182634-Pleurochrysis_carterae.AAC.1
MSVRWCLGCRFFGALPSASASQRVRAMLPFAAFLFADANAVGQSADAGARATPRRVLHASTAPQPNARLCALQPRPHCVRRLPLPPIPLPLSTLPSPPTLHRHVTTIWQ